MGLSSSVIVRDQVGSAEGSSLSEAELRSIVNFAPQMLGVMEPDGRVSWVNEGALDYFGISPEDTNSDDLRTRFTHPDDILKFSEARQSAFSRGVPFEAEQRFLGKDGKYRWFLIRCRPVKDPEGRVLRWYGGATDIEERKRAEDSLRRSEAYLAEAQKLTQTGSWAFTPARDGATYWSEEMFRIWGFDPQLGPPSNEEVIQRIHPEDVARIRELMGKAYTGGLTTDFATEHRIVLSDGTVKHIHGTCRPIFDDAGTIVKYVGTAVDVTERNRTEEARKELEDQWEAAFQSNPTMYFIVDESGQIVSVNPFGAEQLGYTVSELAGQTVFNVFYEPDRRAVQAHAAACFEQPGRMMQWEARKTCKDGTIIWVRETGNAVFLKKRAVLLIACENITERKRAEDALRRSEAYLAESQKLTKTGSWAYNPFTGKTIYWSDEMFRIFGLDPREGVPSGQRFGQLIHPEDHDRWKESVQRSLRQRTDYSVEHRIILSDGSVRNIEEIGHPVLNSSGEVVEFVGTAIDVTERKRVEAERKRLRQLETDLAHMNRVSMMGELAASLAHEIKQPIAAAATNAETSLLWLQGESPQTGEARDAISRVMKDVIRAADIIDRNSSLYKRDTPTRASVNLNELIREMTRLLYDAANRHSVSIRAKLGSDLPTITADRVQIQQVLMNLMLNGIEAMKGTGGQLTIESKEIEDDQIVLSVSDTGIGLPAESAERIFDAFFTTKAQGTGMGLSISRRIIESHGGRLWASSNPDRGATFQFTLPAD